ncbi:MAG: hypothetical protein ACQEVT_07940 [Pseudomonadota bacterium]|uniref:hypothetical protein n=1 Tax=Roseovarius TaxID=74030 RepID=UPI0022A82FB2|nr:hypothetical protein [Roseovarius sp. EGI FJ00037]MCZ0812706.1 hypothetical protein [Roseovarius sp. EGI FJ00037]
MRRIVSIHCRSFRALCAGCVLAACIGLALPGAAAADRLRLAVPQALRDSGLLTYVLPRFSLKTGVGVDLVPEGAEAELSLEAGGTGRAVFAGPQATWRMTLHDSGHADAARFADWLRSDIGQRTVAAYELDGETPFSPPERAEATRVAPTFAGDAALGKTLSNDLCGRCHVVSEETRMNDIGSTPSFFMLRAMRDWARRFETFYVLNPHPSFTQVEDVTPPFHIERPPPIIPVEMSLDDLEAIMAYVAAMTPADLGAPIRHQ